MPNTREKLIELLETVVSPKDVLCDGEVLVSTSRVADHLIANGVTIQKWIPVTERLPIPNELDEKGFYKAYFVATNNGFRMHTALWDGERWTLWGKSHVLKDVTHWMPLPEPPKEA